MSIATFSPDPNEKLYQALAELGTKFLNTKEHWRGSAYRNAVAGLRTWYKKRVKSGRPQIRFTNADADIIQKSPACGGAKNVGKKIAKKIKDWNDTFDPVTGEGTIGQLQKFRELDADEVFESYGLAVSTPREKTIAALAKIPYVGPTTASCLLGKIAELKQVDPVEDYGPDGIVKALQELMNSPNPPDLLDSKQEVSLRYIEQTSKRIERRFISLAASCFAFVLEEAYGPQSPIKWSLTIGGSYYRGQPDSGDLDLILYVPGKNFVLDDAVRLLKRYGLVFEQFSLGVHKFLGLGRCGSDSPQGSSRVFKVDILFVNEAIERSFALLHYTLGEVANRRLRQDAKKADMKLEQTGLYANKGLIDKDTGKRRRIDLGEGLDDLTTSQLEERINQAIERVDVK